MNLPAAIQYLFPTAVLGDDVVIIDSGDGQGFRLAAWRLADPQPTAEHLADAWTAVQAQEAAKEALWSARKAMATLFHSLDVDVRAYHTPDYAAVEASIARGDVAAAKRRIETMSVCPSAQDPEALRAQFLAYFPA